MSDNNREIGKILTAARREQKKSIKDVSEGTKIMEHYLEALEAGDPSKLPSIAYFQLFSRSYAEYLGIDPSIFDEVSDQDPALAEIISDDETISRDDGDEGEAVVSESQVQAKRFGRSLIYLVVAIFVIFIAFLGYNYFFVEGDGNLFDLGTEESMMDETQSLTEEHPDQAELIIPDTPYQPPEKLKLYMRAKRDVWALVVRDGDTVLNRRLVAGAERQWEADYRYHLTLGISSAVDLFVNDRELAPLAEQARTISGLEINQINYREFYPPPESAESEAPVEQATTNEATSQPATSSYPVLNDGDSADVRSEDTADGD
jgi:transcriptional regulator with XRE-family HTH domain